MPAKLLASITLVLSQFFVCFDLSANTPKHIKTEFIVIPSPNSLDSNGRPSGYFEKLLKLALSKTQTNDNPVEFHYFQHTPEKERLRMMLIQNQGIDLIWSSSNKKREKEMLAIKVNLLKGINEYRILLIRAEDQHNFDQVQTLEDLQIFLAGTGLHWSDTDVFEKNNFNVFTTGDYQNMFSALQRKRFDFIPRGIQEIESELKQYGHLNLIAEKNLLLHYSQPVYFFVNKSNKKLAKRIKEGLKIAKEDGSFDQLFFEIPEFKAAYEQLQNHNRHLLELKTD
jgi:ABC-type amino acid transport substrate-binding protein